MGEVQALVALSQERRQAQPEALLSYIEKQIKQSVVSGELRPGAKLSPSAVAANLGVSHIPVREALTSLAASGYLEHRPRVGFFVRILSSEDLADIYHWREILEREAFMVAIPKITGDDIDEMRRLCGQMRKVAGSVQRREYLNLNRQFHFIAFRQAGSDRLLRFLTYLWDAAAPYTFAGLVDAEKAQRDHERMIPRFEARDEDGIIELMTQHRGLAVDAVARWEARERP
ncbi:MAG TPA: GntR family transcriptional regulator [Streptosporangiaceae bacterium]|jgi:DNA-binding GntR family transcriptional regulator